MTWKVRIAYVFESQDVNEGVAINQAKILFKNLVEAHMITERSEGPFPGVADAIFEQAKIRTRPVTTVARNVNVPSSVDIRIHPIERCDEAIFYPTGVIATGTARDGTAFELLLTGNWNVNYDDPNEGRRTLRGDGRFDLIHDLGLVDTTLNGLIDDGTITFNLNGWFELSYLRPRTTVWTSTEVIAHRYSEAIANMKSFIQDYDMEMIVLG